MKKVLSASRHILFMLAVVLALPGIGFAAPSKGAEKPKLVLMPLTTKGVDDSMKSSMESALINGLQEKYKVFAGERVAKKVQEVFDKVSKKTKAGQHCDDTMCMQDIAIAFQADLVAIASVVKRESGYFLTLNIRNIGEDTVILSETVPCEKCSETQVVEKLKTISHSGSSGPSSPSFVSSSPAESPAVTGGIEDISPTSTSSQGTGPAGIYITTEPKGAEVYLGDILAGKADPAFQKLNMTAGQRVQITLKLPEYNPSTFEALLKSGITRYEGIKLKPAFGYLTVKGKPEGAAVEIGGNQIGELPLKKLKLKSGKHLLTVHKKLYETVSDRIIEVKDGQDTTEAITLNEAFGTLNISSNPTDADILVDGKGIGKTPLQGYRMSPGKYELTVTKSGYTEKKYTATLTKGKEFTITSEKTTLREKVFSAQIFTDPPEQGARVYVDGIDKGEAPLTVDNLTEGPHKVEVRTKEKLGLMDVTGKDGESKMVEVKLKENAPEKLPVKLKDTVPDGTFTDNATRLMWQQGEGGKMNWVAAIAYCKNLSLAGYNDWRLPDIKELRSIIADRKKPAINKTNFPNANPSFYWSSSTNPYGTMFAWYVHFERGRSGNNENESNSNYVRCVRGGQ